MTICSIIVSPHDNMQYNCIPTWQYAVWTYLMLAAGSLTHVRQFGLELHTAPVFYDMGLDPVRGFTRLLTSIQNLYTYGLSVCLYISSVFFSDSGSAWCPMNQTWPLPKPTDITSSLSWSSWEMCSGTRKAWQCYYCIAIHGNVWSVKLVGPSKVHSLPLGVAGRTF